MIYHCQSCVTVQQVNRQVIAYFLLVHQQCGVDCRWKSSASREKSVKSTASLHITYCEKGEIWGWYVDDLL